MKDNFKSGIISVVGRPNVGKSTLINSLTGQDWMATSSHPHTTRRQIRSIETTPDHQIVYVDTPGIHKPKGKLSEQMNDYAYDSLDEVEAIVCVFDGSKQIGKGDSYIASILENKKNVIAVLNKCDAEKNIENIASRAQQVAEQLPNVSDIFMISAFTGKNVKILKKRLYEFLIESPPIFEIDQNHDLSDEQLVSEFYREALIRILEQELPQSVAVVVSEDTENQSKNTRYFNIKILVSKKSHKPMIIGKSGNNLQNVGTRVRKRLEAIMGCLIYLDVKVEVDENWQANRDHLDSYIF